MEFAHTFCSLKLEYPVHHSFLATHCCHQVLPQFWFFSEIIMPLEIETCSAVGEKDLEFDKAVPKKKDVK